MPGLPESIVGASGITLRIPTKDDGVAVFEAVTETLRSLRQYSAFMSWANHAPSVAASTDYCLAARAAFEDARDYSYLVVSSIDNRVLGTCGLHGIDFANHVAEIGFWCRASEQGKGIIADAVRIIAEAAFERLGVRHILAVTDSENRACRRLCERLGFELQDERARDRTDIRGAWRNACVYRASTTAIFHFVKKVLDP